MVSEKNKRITLRKPTSIGVKKILPLKKPKNKTPCYF